MFGSHLAAKQLKSSFYYFYTLHSPRMRCSKTILPQEWGARIILHQEWGAAEPCFPKNGEQKLFSPENEEQQNHTLPKMGSMNYTLSGMGSNRTTPPKNGGHELCSPKNGEQHNHTSPRMWSRNYASQQSMVSINRLRRGGWQKSWVHGALDLVLDYGAHQKSQVQINELSSNQAQQNKSR